MKYLYASLLVVLFFKTANSQILRGEYCNCAFKGKKIIESIENKTVFAKIINYEEGFLTIDFYNNTSDTVYLFKTYFEEGIIDSPDIYRYNKKKKLVEISFLPLISQLSVDYSDVIILSNRLRYSRTTVYDFYTILPFHKYSLFLKTLPLKYRQKFIRSVDVSAQSIKKSNRFKLNTKLISLPKNKDYVKYVVELAYYKDISVICDDKKPRFYYKGKYHQHAKRFYINAKKFNEHAKNFSIISMPLQLSD